MATERRKIIDELAGVAEFDRRIEQAQEELESYSRQKLTSKKLFLAKYISRLEILRMDRDQALKYLGIKDEKEGKEKSLFSRAIKN